MASRNPNSHIFNNEKTRAEPLLASVIFFISRD